MWQESPRRKADARSAWTVHQRESEPMPRTPAVTVGISFYNAEAALLDAVRSVFAQTFQDWELILVDDGSTDISLDIARSIDDSRVRVFSDGLNRKLAARLNQIHGAAAATYAARMDADDLMHPLRLEKQMAFVEEHPDVDVVGSRAYMMQVVDGVRDVYGLSAAGLAARDFEAWETLDRRVLMHPTVMARAQWFRENPYDETYATGQDAELWCRTCRQSRMLEMEEPLHFYAISASADGIVRRYLRGVRIRRRQVRRYGPGLVGWPGTMMRIASTYWRDVRCMGCRLVNRPDLLVPGRGPALDAAQQEAAYAALETILKTEVPQLRAFRTRARQT